MGRHGRRAMNGKPAVKIQRVVKLAEIAFPPTGDAGVNAKMTAGSLGNAAHLLARFFGDFAIFAIRAGGDGECAVQPFIVVNQQNLTRNINLNPGHAQLRVSPLRIACAVQGFLGFQRVSARAFQIGILLKRHHGLPGLLVVTAIDRAHIVPKLRKAFL